MAIGAPSSVAWLIFSRQAPVRGRRASRLEQISAKVGNPLRSEFAPTSSSDAITYRSNGILRAKSARQKPRLFFSPAGGPCLAAGAAAVETPRLKVARREPRRLGARKNRAVEAVFAAEGRREIQAANGRVRRAREARKNRRLRRPRLEAVHGAFRRPQITGHRMRVEEDALPDEARKARTVAIETLFDCAKPRVATRDRLLARQTLPIGEPVEAEHRDEMRRFVPESGIDGGEVRNRIGRQRVVRIRAERLDALAILRKARHAFRQHDLAIILHADRFGARREAEVGSKERGGERRLAESRLHRSPLRRGQDLGGDMGRAIGQHNGGRNLLVVIAGLPRDMPDASYVAL